MVTINYAIMIVIYTFEISVIFSLDIWGNYPVRRLEREGEREGERKERGGKYYVTKYICMYYCNSTHAHVQ